MVWSLEGDFYEYPPEELEAAPGEKVLLLRRADWFRAQPGLLVLMAITFPGGVSDCSSWAGFIGDVATELISGIWKCTHIKWILCTVTTNTVLNSFYLGSLKKINLTYYNIFKYSNQYLCVCVVGNWNSLPVHLAVLNVISSIPLIYVTIKLTLNKLHTVLDHPRIKKKKKTQICHSNGKGVVFNSVQN